MKNEIKIAYTTRPFWQSVIAAFLYTIVIAMVWIAVYRMRNPALFTVDEYRGSVVFLEIAIFPLFFALNFSTTKEVYINIEKKKIRDKFIIGAINFSDNYNIPSPEYVSVFFDSPNSIYQINLWCKGNKIFRIAGFEQLDPALEFGKTFSDKLKLDLLDATEKGNSKWIEK